MFGLGEKAKQSNPSVHTPCHSVDNCPRVPNPPNAAGQQPNRDGDAWGDACDTTGCHPACATGCSKPNDASACTTPFYDGKAHGCLRCAENFHAVAGKSGCMAGAPTDKCKPSPFPLCVQTFENPVLPAADTESVDWQPIAPKSAGLDWSQHWQVIQSTDFYPGVKTVSTLPGVNVGFIDYIDFSGPLEEVSIGTSGGVQFRPVSIFAAAEDESPVKLTVRGYRNHVQVGSDVNTTLTASAKSTVSFSSIGAVDRLVFIMTNYVDFDDFKFQWTNPKARTCDAV